MELKSLAPPIVSGAINKIQASSLSTASDSGNVNVNSSRMSDKSKDIFSANVSLSDQEPIRANVTILE